MIFISQQSFRILVYVVAEACNRLVGNTLAYRLALFGVLFCYDINRLKRRYSEKNNNPQGLEKEYFMKTKFAKLICLMLIACLAFTLVLTACNEDAPVEDALALKLKQSLKNYLASESFENALASAQSTQERVPLLYLRYVKGDYIASDVDALETRLSLIDNVSDSDGNLDDTLYTEESGLYTVVSWGEYSYVSGWLSISDYLYSWSLFYNQYLQNATNGKDYSHYLARIKAYLTAIDNDALTYVGTAWGYDKASTLTLCCANLGFDAKTTVPTSYAELLSYYAKDENGRFTKEGVNPNWVGFTGRPLAASVLRADSAYSLEYEKTMQPLFPYEENYTPTLAECVNLDGLCNFYGYTLPSEYSTVDSRYGLLYGYVNGIDMRAYKKSVYHSAVCGGENCAHHVDEEDGKIYNIVEMWLSSLEKDANGDYVLNDAVDMAIAISYVAYSQGVTAPTPIGAYTESVSTISLG